MCGITGCLQPGLDDSAWRSLLGQMTMQLRHRGPDGQGMWFDAQAGVGLGHRRLAIIDTSQAASQPMSSPSGRFMITYNGEVYNFQELRNVLTRKGYVFRSSSDTEVVLAAFERWGVRKALDRFAGMFAFAAWDRQEHVLYLARDRLGIKPLYYSWCKGALVFGSQLRAVSVHPDFQTDLSQTALQLYLRFGYVPSTHTIYRKAHRVAPGTLLKVGADSQGMKVVRYWSIEKTARRSLEQPFPGGERAALIELERLLKGAVDSRRIADVPLGALLSGGVDSSTVVALMQQGSDRRVKTFSIGFLEKEYDESHYARRVARRLGTDHTELSVSPREAMLVIPKLSEYYDEPFADSSQIPTLLVSHLASRQVKVVLSGDGGDELFAGYSRYFRIQRNWRRISRIPSPIRTAIAHLPQSHQGWGRLSLGVFHRYLSYLKVGSLAEMYRQGTSIWEPTRIMLPGGNSVPEQGLLPTVDWIPKDARLAEREILQMMYWDTLMYLPDDILTKVDRASMAFGLEARVPLLDHRIVEFAWRLPLENKVRKDRGKVILRKLLEKYLPASLVHRPKAGFGVPIGQWLRGPLRDWAEDLLDASKIRQQGIFDERAVRRVWSAHCRGTSNQERKVWCLLVFQAWLAETRS